MEKIMKIEENKVLTETEKAKATEFGNFMQKLIDEGKLSAYLKELEETGTDDSDALLK